MNRRLLAGLLIGGVLFAALRTDTSAQAAAPEGALHWLWLGGERLALVRVRARIGGRPSAEAFADARRDYASRLFRMLDRDGDGGLSEAEAQRCPPPQLQLAAANHDPSEVHFAFNFRALDRDADGRLTPRELADYLAAYSDGPLRMASGGGGVQGDPLFARLDADRDGHVAADELAAAVALLASLDRDDDEALGRDELAGQFAPADMEVFQPQSPRGRLVGVTSPQQAAALLIETYRPAADRSAGLSPDELPLPPTAFDRLDDDGDGRLAAAELSGYLDGPADVELVVELAPGAGQSPLAIVAPAGKAGDLAAVLDARPSDCLLSIGAALQLGVAVSGIGGGPDALSSALAEDFSLCDADADGALSTDELGKSLLRQAAALADADGDGQADPAEIESFASLFLAPYVQVSVRRASFWLSPHGDGLFDLLDADRDGRLGLRELRAAPRAAARWDADRDGRLAPRELPAGYALSVGPMHAGPTAGLFDPVLPAEALDLLVADAPRWFRKMDANGDGDVSWREFLGDREAFARLDLDGDQLLTRAEAELAE